MYGKVSDPGMGINPLRVALALSMILSQSAIGQWGSGSHAVRSGLDPGDHRFCRQVVGVVKV